VLEGFDFGVGLLLPLVGHTEAERGQMLDTIGPVWDGNEVWLVIAAGATFAAFPVWYATLFSGLYQALLLVLVLLIVRVVSFEWRHRSDGARWKRTWLGAHVVASIGIPLIWGIALANLVHGVPLDSQGNFAGSFTDLLSPYTVFAGIATVALFALHGAVFLELKTVGTLRTRAIQNAKRLAPVVIPFSAVFLGWTVLAATQNNAKSAAPAVMMAIAATAVIATGGVLAMRGLAGRAFVATALGVVLTVATIFTSLFPRVLVSDPNFQNSLTVANSAAAHYALTVITVVAVVVTPIVVIYQGWTYRVFRRRLTDHTEQPET
jgi:cytochrome d ubiquinol oxidase subunit II